MIEGSKRYLTKGGEPLCVLNNVFLHVHVTSDWDLGIPRLFLSFYFAASKEDAQELKTLERWLGAQDGMCVEAIDESTEEFQYFSQDVQFSPMVVKLSQKFDMASDCTVKEMYNWSYIVGKTLKTMEERTLGRVDFPDLWDDVGPVVEDHLSSFVAVDWIFGFRGELTPFNRAPH